MKLLMMENVDTINQLKLFIGKNCNKLCADCRSTSIKFVSLTFGVFICARCASVHETLNEDVRPVNPSKSNSETWNENAVKRLIDLGGNDAINGRLEAELPHYYRRPWPSVNCPSFLIEVFIKSKYVHEEFSKGAIARNAQCQFACAEKSGILLKKLRDSDNFCERFFELSVERNYLKYFIKPGDSEPKETLPLEKLNMTFIDHYAFDVPPHTALIQFVQEGSTRHLFLRSEDSRTIINWYNAIRLGKYHRICLNYTCMGLSFSASEVAATLTRDLDMAGWLSKTGPRKTDAWRRRWCMLSQRHLLYTDKPLSAFAKGELFIGSSGDGFSVTSGTPENWKRHTGYAFTIHTTVRPFVFVSDSQEEQLKWISAMQEIMNKPLTLDETKRAAYIINKHLNV
ncbi:hypothetical protein AHF37_12216 [Paragonimus kellicotti]|nr:hypothetical protein AHF37_12216 [Paragonimus kellicotti]